MRYLYFVLLPALLQAAITWGIVESNTGNGSWLGLTAFLIALPAIPVTACINGLRCYRYPDANSLVLLGQSLLVAALAPLVVVLMVVIA